MTEIMLIFYQTYNFNLSFFQGNNEREAARGRHGGSVLLPPLLKTGSQHTQAQQSHDTQTS